MRAGAVASTDLSRDGRRLTGGYHLAEDQQAIRVLLALRADARVSGLVEGRGVFRGPIFRRIFAAGPQHGSPYVSASDLVQLDIRPDGWLSALHGALLTNLRLHEGMILVTCSGMNLGRAIWGWPGIANLCASHDLIRIEPDSEKVPPGYLFAFLACRFGRAAIRKQIYGGNIKHVEPHHVANILVPRLSSKREQQIHELITESARLRGRAVASRAKAIDSVERWLKWESIDDARNWSTASSSGLSRRMDAHFANPPVVRARAALAGCNVIRSRPEQLGRTVIEVFEPNRGARLQVIDPAAGIPFMSSSQVFRLDPVGEYLVSRKTPHLDRLIVRDTDILIPRSGQRGGIIGRAVRPLRTYLGAAASEHLVRVRCRTSSDADWIWAVLASQPGYLAVLGTAYGSSIPSLDCRLIGDLMLAAAPTELRTSASFLVRDYVECASAAIVSERAAIEKIESEFRRRANG